MGIVGGAAEDDAFGEGAAIRDAEKIVAGGFASLREGFGEEPGFIALRGDEDREAAGASHEKRLVAEVVDASIEIDARRGGTPPAVATGEDIDI